MMRSKKPMRIPESLVRGFFNKNCITNINMNKKRILLEVDLTITKEDEKVLDSNKLLLIIPTIKYLFDEGCSSILMISNFGERHRTEGSLESAANELHSILFTYYGITVTFLGDVFDEGIVKLCYNTPPKHIFLIENLRLDAKERRYITNLNKLKSVGMPPERLSKFRRLMKKLSDNYVIENYCLSYHRSSLFLGAVLPHRKLGLFAMKELCIFHHMLCDPFRPFIAVIGGTCNKKKLKIILNLLNYVDELIIAGDVSLIFLNVIRNTKIGDLHKLLLDDCKRLVQAVLKKAKARNKHIYFPLDFKISHTVNDLEKPVNVKIEDEIPCNYQRCDIGTTSLYHFPQIIERARTILIYGTMGMIERQLFQEGTLTVLKAIAERTDWGGLSVVVGNSTTNFARQSGFCHKFSHMSATKDAHRVLLGQENKALGVIKLKNDKCGWPEEAYLYGRYEEERAKLMRDIPRAARLPNYIDILTRPETDPIKPEQRECIAPCKLEPKLSKEHIGKLLPHSGKELFKPVVDCDMSFRPLESDLIEKSYRPGDMNWKCGMYPKCSIPKYKTLSEDSVTKKQEDMHAHGRSETLMKQTAVNVQKTMSENSQLHKYPIKRSDTLESKITSIKDLERKTSRNAQQTKYSNEKIETFKSTSINDIQNKTSSKTQQHKYSKMRTGTLKTAADVENTTSKHALRLKCPINDSNVIGEKMPKCATKKTDPTELNITNVSHPEKKTLKSIPPDKETDNCQEFPMNIFSKFLERDF